MNRRSILGALLVLPLCGCMEEDVAWPNHEHWGRRLGRLSQWISPGYSWCGRCKTTWNWVEGHSTQFLWCEGDNSNDKNSGSGMFPLCEYCWHELTPEQRLPFYLELNNRWGTDGAALDEAMIRRSVMREEDGPPPSSLRSFTRQDGTTVFTTSLVRTGPDDPGYERWWCK